MLETELQTLIQQIQQRQCEGQTVEVKSAHKGCPEGLYDTLSSFSNQDSGGVMVFGLDEKQGFAKVGVYDAQELQRKVKKHCEQMTPVVRPIFTVYDEGGKLFVSAEIPPMDIAERPCFKTAKGRLKGSYVRMGEADNPMSEYEVYSFEAFRRKYRDDIRPSELTTLNTLEQSKLETYLSRMCQERPNLAQLSREQQLELAGVTRNGAVTLAAALIFGIYPQAWFPHLRINATCIPGTEKGQLDAAGNRFSDSRHIDGTLTEMLNEAMSFVQKNMRTAIRIDSKTGQRIDTPQYPLEAVREAILNALVHRDYSFHTEGMPIQLDMYSDRLEIINPGGLYGRLTLDNLGRVQPDTRNPLLVTMMENLGQTENRYSGIPTMRKTMAQHHLPEPQFEDSRTCFKVILFHETVAPELIPPENPDTETLNLLDSKGLLNFCRTPKSRAEIVDYLGMESGQYALRRYLDPLVQVGAIRLTLPDKPRSSKQQYVTHLH